MADTQAASDLEHKAKLPCKFGTKCRRRDCWYAHPSPPATDSGHAAAAGHDPPVQPPSDPKAAKNAGHNDNKVEATSDVAAHSKTAKKKATKPCKYGANCHRKKCPFLHPKVTSTSSLTVPSESTDDDAMAKNAFESSKNRNGNRQSVSGVSADDKTETAMDATTGEPPSMQGPPSPDGKTKSSRRCWRGAKCRRANCKFEHPAPDDSPQGAMIDVSTGASDDVPQVMWAADLEDSLVAEAREKEHRPEKKSHRRKKRDKETDRRRARQQEEDRLIQAEEERLRLKEEEERIQQELQEQERQRQAEAEEEAQRLRAQQAEEAQRLRALQAEEAQRLRQQQTEEELLLRQQQADEARVEIDRIRREKIAQEQARQQQIEEEERLRLREQQADEARKEIEGIRQKKLAREQERERKAEERKKQERVRIEREALERFKRAHAEEKKNEEAARRLEEEERKQLNQQDGLIRREREEEEERRRLAQQKEEERRRQAQVQQAHAQQAQLQGKDRHRQVQLQEEASHCDDSDEERERYKAERKAAKKERRRLEREVKAEQDRKVEEAASKKQSSKTKQEQSVKFESLSPSPTGSNQENVFEANAPEAVEDEAAKKRRWQEELRVQKERAAEKKAQKQKIRRQRSLEDYERQTRERTQFWQEEIADEKKTVDMVVELCGAEFCRNNPDVHREMLLVDADARHKLEEASQETYRAVCKADIHSRVAVKGMKQQDLNDRTGTIQSWDEGKGKFYVGLDTKKGKNTQYLYIPAGNLEALPLPSPRKGKKKGDPVHMVFITSLFAGNELMVDVYKSDIDAMKASPSLDKFLNKLMQDRDQEERDAKEREEEERRQEEESRRRRHEQRRRENEEWERRQAEYAAQKAEYQEWRRQQREEKRANEERAHSFSEDDGEHSPFCHCPRCALEHMFFGGMGMGGGMGGSGRGGFTFTFGRGGPSFTFVFDDDDYDDYEDQWDREWGRMHEEEQAEKDAEAAEVLGVEVDAGDAEIKRVFRKKARKYHPDSYRAENHEDGMTKVEAEEHFKELSNAYDHLMSNFDESNEDKEYE